MNGIQANRPKEGAGPVPEAESSPHLAADLDVLTGLRTGKRSFYPEYVRSNQGLERAVEALDRISRALVRTADGPRALVEAVVRAAAEHIEARWLLLALADGALRAARPRFLLYDDGDLIDDSGRVPPYVREHLDILRTRPWEAGASAPGDGWVRVTMILDDEPVGGIVARPGAGLEIAATDLSVLRVLANQAAVALHNSFLLHAAIRLRGQREQLYEAAERRARDLAERSAELAETQQQLLDAMHRQALDDERHRIARELHDSVAQIVLSAGMTIEVCRAEMARMDGRAQEVAQQLVTARNLTQQAAERLRVAIYALHQSSAEPPGPLPVMLERLSHAHRPNDLHVTVKAEGRPVPLPPRAEQSLLRLAGEALFNAAAHGKATQAVVKLRYLPSKVSLSVSDNGTGDPAQLRRALRLAQANDLSGRHRGLANMLLRAEELDGTLVIRPSGMGGIRLTLVIPLPIAIDQGARDDV
jgi:signal transduction histidine kinase